MVSGNFQQLLLCLIAGRPAPSAAMPVLLSFSGPKMGFSPHRGDTLPTVPNFTWAEMWEYSPKTIKVSNFSINESINQSEED